MSIEGGNWEHTDINKKIMEKLNRVSNSEK